MTTYIPLDVTIPDTADELLELIGRGIELRVDVLGKGWLRPRRVGTGVITVRPPRAGTTGHYRVPVACTHHAATSKATLFVNGEPRGTGSFDGGDRFTVFPGSTLLVDLRVRWVD